MRSKLVAEYKKVSVTSTPAKKMGGTQSTCFQNSTTPFAPSDSQCQSCYSSTGCCPSDQRTQQQACIFSGGGASCAKLSSAQASQLYGWSSCASSGVGLVHCASAGNAAGDCTLVWWRLWVAILVPLFSLIIACIVGCVFCCCKNRNVVVVEPPPKKAGKKAESLTL